MKLNLVIPEGQVKILLYMVVLLSGVSILLRKDKAQAEGEGKAGYQITEHLPATLALGFVTGMICSLSGAGGPVLVMPLLVVLGVNVRTAVGDCVVQLGFHRHPGLHRLHDPVLRAGSAARAGGRAAGPRRWGGIRQ